jgi:signal transduction histidine kinase
MYKLLTDKSIRQRMSAWLTALLLIVLASWVLGPSLSAGLVSATGPQDNSRIDRDTHSVATPSQGRTTRSGPSAAATNSNWPGTGTTGAVDNPRPLTLRALWAQRDGALHLAPSSMAVLTGSLALGLIALLLALTQRNRADAALAGACLLWAVHTALGEPAFAAAQRGMLQALLLGFCGLTGWYALRVLDVPVQRRGAVLPAFGLTMIALLVWALGAAGAMDTTVGQTLVLLMVVGMGLVLLVQVVDTAHRDDLSLRARFGAWAVALTLAAALACVVHELGRLFGVAALLNAALPGAGSSEATRWAVLALLSVLTAVRVDQVARTIRRLENDHRVSRKREREVQHTLQATLDELYARDRSDAQRQQRDRLLRELHDEIGQRVSRALELTHPAGTGPSYGEASTGSLGGRGSMARTLQLQGLLDTTLLDLRLALTALDRNNPLLSDAMNDLRQHIEPLMSARGVHLQWLVGDSTGRLRLGMAETLQMLRIAQEALINVLHYAESAGQATLTLDVVSDQAGRTLRLTVRDGAGVSTSSDIDITPLPSPSRNDPGWGTLQRQVNALGAQLAVGREAEGWKVEVSLALHAV